MQTSQVSDTRKRLEKLSPSDSAYRSLLHELLSHEDLRSYVQGLRGSDLKGFVELLDKALSHIPVTDDLFRKTLRRLQSTCSNREILPRSYLIQSGRISSKGKAIASGGAADAHEAELNGKKVCVKALRLYVQSSGNATKKAFYKEVVVWKRLQHPNIVPFLGVPTKIPPFEIVCEWMENDRITTYVKEHPEVDHIGLLWDVADGLHYLHSCNIIHGDLKGANVLIDRSGRARLTDFGLTFIIHGENSIVSPQASTSPTSPTAWAAPEVLGGGPVSKEGDIFTFAMLAVEVFTGHSPFTGNYHAAVFAILSGKHPERPKTLHHEGLWKIMEECWSKESSRRPTTSQLLGFFQRSFPGKRETPDVQPLPSASSTWTLVDDKEHVEGNTRPRPDPSKKDTADEPGPQDPPPVGVQAEELVPGNKPDPPRTGPAAESRRSPPQTEDKPSLFKRAVKRLKKSVKRLFGRKTPK